MVRCPHNPVLGGCKDHAYSRSGFCNLFPAIEPLRGWCAEAERIALVKDNLNTSSPAPLPALCA